VRSKKGRRQGRSGAHRGGGLEMMARRRQSSRPVRTQGWGKRGGATKCSDARSLGRMRWERKGGRGGDEVPFIGDVAGGGGRAAGGATWR
jgi:hypothetical protein